jgi:DNA repair exonuclease SbcCD nuclease subunit
VRIALISDTHLGFGKRSELVGDSFSQAEEAIDSALAKGADIILIAGDIFHERIPTQEVWAKAMRVLTKPVLSRAKSKARLISVLGKEHKDISPIAVTGVPVVAIHGTHERRGKELVNPIQALESGGFLVHLHCNGVIFEIGGKKIAIQGMSGVPESYALDVLRKWNPSPIKLIDSYNILMLHQSIRGYVYYDEDNPVISVEDFPKGFDLYVCGHVHMPQTVRKDESLIVFPGSTVVTQLTQQEAGVKKGFYLIDTDSGVQEFIPLESQREFVYRELEAGGLEKSQIRDMIKREVDALLRANFSKPPLVRIKLTGNVNVRLNFPELEKEFEGKAILSVSSASSSSDLGEKIKIVRELHSKRMSVDDLGFSILSEQVKSINPEFLNTVFESLAEGKVEEVMQILLAGIPPLKSQETKHPTFDDLESLMKEVISDKNTKIGTLKEEER